MSTEGRVDVRLNRRTGEAAVAFHQPGDMARLLAGRAPDEAVRMVPLLYSLCRTAQGQASVRALEQAVGRRADPATRTARDALAAMESLREHTVRIALAWPGFLGLAPSGQDVAGVMGFEAALTGALFAKGEEIRVGGTASPDHARAASVVAAAETLLAERVFGEPLAVWRQRQGWDALRAWAGEQDTVAARLIGRVASDGWLDIAGSAPVPMVPPPPDAMRDWLEGADKDPIGVIGPAASVPESTPFARHAGRGQLAPLGLGLGARLVARLVDLAGLPDRLRALLDPAAVEERGEDDPGMGGIGVGVVEAARGTLIHVARVDDGGRITDYRVLPPTLWNFAARGACARCLSLLRAEDEAVLARQANLIVTAIDPCVAHAVRIE